jgi:hypothetical protein
VTAVERLHATRDSAAHAAGARAAPARRRTRRWIVGASVAQPRYDHAIASIAVCLFAALTHAQATAGADQDRT